MHLIIYSILKNNFPQITNRIFSYYTTTKGVNISYFYLRGSMYDIIKIDMQILRSKLCSSSKIFYVLSGDL